MEKLVIEVSMPTLKSDISCESALILAHGEEPVWKDMDVAAMRDLKVWYTRYLMMEERDSDAAAFIDRTVFDQSIDEWPLLHHGWLWLVRMSIFIKSGDYQLALGSAETALGVLVGVTNKRNEDYLAIIASLLYSLAMVHKETKDNSRAVKELTKAQKLFERLVKRDNARFSAMLVHASEASTLIYKNRAAQMRVLAQYQNMTDIYTAMLNEDNGDRTREALENLVESLRNQGDIMLQMGNARNSVKFYTKALRYQMKINPNMGQKELDLSIGLARALLRLVNRRAAAEQLLNSLRPLAQRLDATAEIAEIEQLLNNRTKNFNIMTMLKGLG